jgi:hypothetical protein
LTPVLINGQRVDVFPDGRFYADYTLKDGQNNIIITFMVEKYFL